MIRRTSDFEPRRRWTAVVEPRLEERVTALNRTDHNGARNASSSCSVSICVLFDGCGYALGSDHNRMRSRRKSPIASSNVVAESHVTWMLSMILCEAREDWLNGEDKTVKRSNHQWAMPAELTVDANALSSAACLSASLE
eukprot:scaffold844_cov254-Pinguiococcus_pyrenoidosus.AAC.12